MQPTSITIPAYNSTTGDGTLSGIATKAGVTVQQILDANKGNTAAIPDANNPDKIIAGAKLTVPTPSVIQTTDAQRAQTQTRSTNLNTMLTATNAPTDRVNGISQNPNVPNADGTAYGTKPGQGGTGGGANGDQNNNGSGNSTGDTSNNGTSGDPFADIKSQISDIQATGLSQITQIKSTLDGVKSTADAGTLALINSLQQIYASREASVTDSYNRLGAKLQGEGFRNGLARYAPAQEAGVLTDNEVQGQMKIAQLQGEMMSQIAKAQQAQTDNDTKLFNDEYDKIDSIQKDMNTAVQGLYKEAVDKQNSDIKAKQLSQKTDQTTLDNGMKTSQRIAPAIADALNQFTNQKDKDDFIEKVATQYGIDPNVLRGDISTAALKTKNTNSEIANRGKKTSGASKTYKSGTFSYTDADLSQYDTAFKKGGTSPTGQQYNGRGTDGYVDPGMYLYNFNDWVTQGGLPKDFISKYPPKDYINPDDNATLPAYLRSSIKGGSSAGSAN